MKNIIISGIPVTSNENTNDVVLNVIQNGLKVDIDVSDITKSYRFKSKNLDSSSGILVSLQNEKIKQKILQERLKLKNDFTLRNIGMGGNNIIFINEDMTKQQQYLFAEARKQRVQKSYKYCWRRNKHIMMRKTEDSKIIYIQSFADLDKL